MIHVDRKTGRLVRWIMMVTIIAVAVQPAQSQTKVQQSCAQHCGDKIAKAPVLSKTNQQILDVHNRYRKEVGVSPLTWSNALARDAQVWANHLASLGGRQLIHDESQNKQGENLWMGTAGAFSINRMIDSWGSEKKNFRQGIFPNVSKTGNWSDVGHYTQIIWRNTTQVGCAKSTAGGNDILVCRYSPAGNFIGQPVL
jgi:hypothetical protein